MAAILDQARLQDRRDAAGSSLARARGVLIAAELEIVMRHAPFTCPEEKALLSRTGGRCEDDADAQLEFDPYSPDEAPLSAECAAARVLRCIPSSVVGLFVSAVAGGAGGQCGAVVHCCAATRGTWRVRA